MLVRRVTMEDLETVCALGQAMVDESSNMFPDVDQERSRITFTQNAEYPDRANLSIAVSDVDIVCGFALAFIADYPYSFDKRGLIDVLYVLPEYRRGRAGPSLMRALLIWFGDVRPIGFMNTTGIDPEGFDSFVRHYGFSPVGTGYRLQ